MNSAGSGIKSLRVNGVKTIQDSLSKAHLLHFPCNETSGNVITDVVSGATLTTSDPTQVRFDVPNAVTFDNASQGFISTLPNGIKSGILVYYFSASWQDNSTMPDGTNNKCSMSHIEVFANTIVDIQRSKSNSTTTIRGIQPTKYQSGVVYTKAWQCNLSGGDSLHGTDFAGIVLLDIGVDMVPRIFLTNKSKRVFNTASSISDTGEGNIFEASANIGDPNGSRLPIDTIDLSTSMPTLYPPAASPTTPLVPVFRHCSLYSWGLYLFKNFNPSDDECVEFVNWMYHNSRVGNKTAYPPWTNKE